MALEISPCSAPNLDPHQVSFDGQLSLVILVKFDKAEVEPLTLLAPKSTIRGAGLYLLSLGEHPAKNSGDGKRNVFLVYLEVFFFIYT